MNIRKILFLCIFASPSLFASPIAEHFLHTGYVEICQQKPTFDSLYAKFDAFIELLQTQPVWAQKLYQAKERFIRSKDRHIYSTHFFGLYDDSKREGRSQISFYYAPHFHAFICSHYPEFNHVPAIMEFFDACFQIQEPYGKVFGHVAMELGLDPIFSGELPPVLFKVVKYLPSYTPSQPHYDGSVFSLFLDSTDPQSLLLSPYKSTLAVGDFSSPPSSSILLIPGTLLTEFSIYPTPHIVAHSGKIRYAAIAFAMRPHYNPPKIELSPLPNF